MTLAKLPPSLRWWIWVAKPYHQARRKPEQYGWVTIAADGSIAEVAVKSAHSEVADASVMIGTFTFGSAESGSRHIDELISAEDTVNGEFYLDSLVSRLLRQGHKVKALFTSSFVSLGTPIEYESALYWQSCFHKWAHHSYSLAADPFVDPTDRALLDKATRDFVSLPREG